MAASGACSQRVSSGIWVCGIGRPAAVLSASAICGAVSRSPVISMALPEVGVRVGEGQRGEGADVVDGDELHDQVVVPGHVERAVLEEPGRAGEVLHEPGRAQDRRGHAQARGCAARSATCRWGPSRAPRRSRSGSRRRRPRSTPGAARPAALAASATFLPWVISLALADWTL